MILMQKQHDQNKGLLADYVKGRDKTLFRIVFEWEKKFSCRIKYNSMYMSY